MVDLRKMTRFPILLRNMISMRKSNDLPFPLNEETVKFCGYGRYALYEGFLALGLKKDDWVMFPDYICNVALAPAHYMGLKIYFYEVGSDLKPVWGCIDKDVAKRSKAFLMVNYFGFPNDLKTAKDFCTKYDLCFIEDNAHGFLSFKGEVPLGKFGDISIFSFHKTIPIPNGSALVINDKSITKKTIVGEELFRGKRTCKYIVKTLIGTLCNNLNHKFCKETDVEMKDLNPSLEADMEFDLKSFFIKMSSYSKWMLHHFNSSSVSMHRREQYEKWLDYFTKQDEFDVGIIFTELKNGVVPYVFPVIAKEPMNLIKQMRRKGVECFPWPYLPKQSKEDYLSKHVVCFPVCS